MRDLAESIVEREEVAVEREGIAVTIRLFSVP